MNIFFLHRDPEQAAKEHVDKHVVKMIVEYAQLLSTAHRMLDGIEYTVYSKTKQTGWHSITFDITPLDKEGKVTMSEIVSELKTNVPLSFLRKLCVPLW